MSDVTALFGNITVADIVAYGVALGTLGVFFKKGIKVITKIHDEEQAKEDRLGKISSDIQMLKEDNKSTKQLINALVEQQKQFSLRQDEIEAQHKARVKNELKDRLLQSYRYYTNIDKNPMLAWSEMEKEVFDELFADYEAYGGNGFMHTTVQPAMENLTVVYMSDTVGFANLMASRKG